MKQKIRKMLLCYMLLGTCTINSIAIDLNNLYLPKDRDIKLKITRPNCPQLDEIPIVYAHDFIMDDKIWTMYFQSEKGNNTVNNIYFVPADFEHLIIDNERETKPPVVLNFLLHCTITNPFMSVRVEYVDSEYVIYKSLVPPQEICNLLTELTNNNNQDFQLCKRLRNEVRTTTSPQLPSTLRKGGVIKRNDTFDTSLFDD